ncbi:MAG: sugar phosphate isomerase/epimerase [Cyclobacteriaceae bacterium]|nr:sugar phosphate isomerase/epimerase [Cyclobacteriaceae bacterium]
MANRRNFIKTGTYIAAGSLILPVISCEQKKKESTEAVPPPPPVNKMGVGLQVYSVRNQLTEDFEGTMKKVADIGFELIEGYGLGTDGKFLGQHDATYYAKVVNDLGMKLVATHCGYFSHDQATATIDAAKAAGVEYLVTPYIPDQLRTNIDGYKAVAENLNKIGELCNAVGIKYGYHNHAFEFEKMEDQIPMEVLIQETQAGLVTFEADLFWTTMGGYDPVQLVKKYPGRISLFHVKDANAEKGEATVGQGTIDFKSIFEAGKEHGLKYYFIEDEREENVFENVKADFEYMKAQDFA